MSSSAGRSGRRWNRLKAEVYAKGGPCCRCGQPIDYSLAYLDDTTGMPNPQGKSVDHYPYPRSTHPHLAEDPANLAPAHLGCNWHAGKRNTAPLGVTSRQW